MDEASLGDTHCAGCPARACGHSPGERAYPDACPTVSLAATLKSARAAYQADREVRKVALAAARTEAAGYCVLTRVEETVVFARRLRVKHLGLAHCMALSDEAAVVERIFRLNGFMVTSAGCKLGAIPKEEVGLRDSEKVHPGRYESLCNPVGQAAVLAAAGSELNVVMGLCVGHDTLFFRHTQVPATVLVVKDRVLGHNPCAAIYLSGTYYKRLLERPVPDEFSRDEQP